MSKNGSKALDSGPKMGMTRKEALMKLLSHVEMEIGRMMVRDRGEKRDRERERESKGQGRRGGGN